MLRTEPVLIEEYVRTGQIRLQFWHILDHANASSQASAAAECAGEQGAFWRMHDVLFEQQGQLRGGNLDVLASMAAELGLDEAAFRQCMASGEKQQFARQVDAQVKAAGVRIRPTFDINGRRIQGSPPLAQWRQVLDEMLEQ